ncbi:MAG: methyltransferase domain-containing protein, partial [Gammaproteobacteria bacterium]
MKILDQLIGRQIRRPTGLAGSLLGNLMAAEHRSLTRWMFEYLKLGPADFVLDVGCGGGMTLKDIAAAATEGLAVGIDYSPTMTRQAARRNRNGIRRGNASVLAGNVMALPFADDSFDVACGVETFYFWPDPLCGLNEIKRVLKPAGRLGLVMDISKEVPGADVT